MFHDVFDTVATHELEIIEAKSIGPLPLLLKEKDNRQSRNDKNVPL